MSLVSREVSLLLSKDHLACLSQIEEGQRL